MFVCIDTFDPFFEVGIPKVKNMTRLVAENKGSMLGSANTIPLESPKVYKMSRNPLSKLRQKWPNIGRKARGQAAHMRGFVLAPSSGPFSNNVVRKGF